MPAQSPTNSPVRHVVGDMVLRHYDFTGVANGDTFTLPANEVVLQVDIAPTTSAAVGNTRSNNVVTFVSGGTWAGRVTIWSKNG